MAFSTTHLDVHPLTCLLLEKNIRYLLNVMIGKHHVSCISKQANKASNGPQGAFSRETAPSTYTAMRDLARAVPAQVSDLYVWSVLSSPSLMVCIPAPHGKDTSVIRLWLCGMWHPAAESLVQNWEDQCKYCMTTLLLVGSAIPCCT